MNTTTRVTLVLLFGVAASLTAQSTNRWDLYQELDWPARQAYLEQNTSPPLDEAFLLQALDLVDSARVESGAENEVSVKKAITIRLMKLLAALPSPKAAPAIERIPLQYRDPVLRGEAWIALAQLGDSAVVPSLVRNLAALNDSDSRSRGDEVQAAYAVQALGALKAADGFRAVAAASQGWYSPASGVRALAKKTLPLLVPDVNKATLDLLANDTDLALKEGLFQTIVDQGDPMYTAAAASAILGQLVNYHGQDPADRERTARLTLATLIGAQTAPSPPVSLVAPLKVLLLQSDSFQLKAHSVRLLGKIDDPSAVQLLTSTLSALNAQQKVGTNKPADLKLVSELVGALVHTGKAGAKPALDEARYSDYPAGLVKEIDAALKQLPQ
jgi:hypothetical protein